MHSAFCNFDLVGRFSDFGQTLKYEISDLELRLSFSRNPTLATLDSVTPPIVFHYSGLKVEKLFSKLEL